MQRRGNRKFIALWLILVAALIYVATSAPRTVVPLAHVHMRPTLGTDVRNGSIVIEYPIRPQESPTFDQHTAWNQTIAPEAQHIGTMANTDGEYSLELSHYSSLSDTSRPQRPVLSTGIISQILYAYSRAEYSMNAWKNAQQTLARAHLTHTSVSQIHQVNAINDDLLPSRYFAATGHNVGGGFLRVFDAHGGLSTVGMPLTEALIEDGIQVQYFERVRMERHPDTPDEIQLTLLGAMLNAARMEEPAFIPHEPNESLLGVYGDDMPDLATQTQGFVYFPQTHHNLRVDHYRFWQEHGGLALFGFPISEILTEPHPMTGQPTVVQYFERARFEYHLGQPGTPYVIQLGLLGREYMQQRKDIGPDMRAPAREIALLGSSTFSFAPWTVSLINVGTAAQKFSHLRIEPGEQVSFLNTVGNLSATSGYAWGGAIVNGRIQKVIAGGVCYLSTAIYQAVLAAGLDIVERHQHSILLSDFSEPPGMDSAVFMFDASGQARSTADLDLVWRNDTPDPIILVTDLSMRGQVNISIWGYHDGRTTILPPPVIEHVIEPDLPIWTEDAELERCEVQQVSKQMPGMSVSVDRVVQAADGHVLHQDHILSYYPPVQDVFKHGSGITLTLDVEQAQQACEGTPKPVLHIAEQEDTDTDTDTTADDANEAALATTTLFMPSLYGKHRDIALAELESMGVPQTNVHIDYQSNRQYPQQTSDCEELTVVSTIPPAEQAFEAMTPIILGVCVADEPEPMPAPIDELTPTRLLGDIPASPDQPTDTSDESPDEAMPVEHEPEHEDEAEQPVSTDVPVNTPTPPVPKPTPESQSFN